MSFLKARMSTGRRGGPAKVCSKNGTAVFAQSKKLSDKYGQARPFHVGFTSCNIGSQQHMQHVFLMLSPVCSIMLIKFRSHTGTGFVRYFGPYGHLRVKNRHIFAQIGRTRASECLSRCILMRSNLNGCLSTRPNMCVHPI